MDRKKISGRRRSTSRLPLLVDRKETERRSRKVLSSRDSSRVPSSPRFFPSHLLFTFFRYFVIFVSVQPSSTTLFGRPLPLPTPQGRRDSQLRTVPEREIRMLRKATPRTLRLLWQTYEGRSAKVTARPETKPPRLTYAIFRSDCHLPAMDSADRRLRPELFRDIARPVREIGRHDTYRDVA